MKKYLTKLAAFFKEEKGASGIEYAIVAAMVAVVIVGFSGDIGGSVSGIFESIRDGLADSGT